MHAIKVSIYQSQQISEFERLAEERFGIAAQVMMQRAGKAAFDFLLRRWPQAQKIAVFCGGGNNGGDGYVLAHEAHERGMQVTIWQVGDQQKQKKSAKEAHDLCQQTAIGIHPFNEKSDLGHPDLIVDAICGIGLHGPLREEVVSAIKKIERLHVPVFALDIPTGIDSDTGCLLGAALHATATMTFIGIKVGLVTGSGVAHTGELICNDLQLPGELFSLIEPVAEKTNLAAYANYLKPRERDWHKGLSGHVLVIGGEQGFSGASRLAGEAALRVGAGLVSVATHPENAACMNIERPELMCHGITSAEDLTQLLTRADVLVLGPGLGQSAWSKMLWDRALATDLPILVDADGLNLLAQKPMVRENWILTPHPGEAARLLQTTPQAIQENRLEAVKAIAKQYGGICVLKGSGSLILSPNALPLICDKGNPGMATAGMGDVLSGVIGGLVGQAIPLGEAAKLGVYLHAMAGDLAAKEGERGMIATDLMPFIRRLANATQG